jgi:lysozyme
MYRFASPAAARHPLKLNADGSTVVPEMLLTMGKTSAMRMLVAFLLLPTWALGANSVVNMSHYDLMRPDFAAMIREGVAGIIHEATFPRLERDARYAERQRTALEAGLLWGAYHFGDATNPVRQADHFLQTVTAAPLDDAAKPRSGVLLVLDFEKNGHYPGGSMSVSQAVAFVERIKERTGKYPGLYCSEYRLRQMLYGRGATSAHRRILTNCWLWIANYHAEPRNTAPWSSWRMWQYCGDGKCDLRPRSMFPKSVANVRKAERNIFRGSNATLQAFWRENAWYPSG